MNKGVYQGGIRTLEDLRIRCRMEDDTGCWIFAGGTSHGKPSVALVIGGRTRAIGGRRAALILAGNELSRDDWVVPYRCANAMCVNPAHAKATTAAKVRKLGGEKTKADPALRAIRVAVGIKARARLSKITPADVLQILADPRPAKDVCKDYGITASNVYAIRARRMWRDVIGGGVVANSSVFNWRPKEAA